MRKTAFVILVLCLSIGAEAQKVFFIYLQSESRTPFYVRLSDKIYSSSSSGYLILSNLKDSTYTLSVGNSGSKNESRFAIPVEASDKGFLLKNFDDGLGLFDLQTLAIHRPVAGSTASQQMVSRTDSFTRRLAKAADDESLLTVPVVAKTEIPQPKEPKKEAVPEIVKAEPAQEAKKEETKPVDLVDTITKTEALKGEEKQVEPLTPPVITQKEPEFKVQDTPALVQPEPVKQQPAHTSSEIQPLAEGPFKRSVIKRRSESSTTEGFGLVYLDVQETATDTIRLLIPNPKKAVTLEENSPAIESAPQVAIEAPTKEPVKEPEPTKQKNNCNNVATEKDFLKLRKNMAAESNDEEMILEAKKYFRTKCFTTEQVRYLSSLFLTNAAKYQFFDAAYQFVSDPVLFPSLGAEIKDEYYSKRFKALIGE